MAAEIVVVEGPAEMVLLQFGDRRDRPHRVQSEGAARRSIAGSVRDIVMVGRPNAWFSGRAKHTKH
jgi:hypothetical protein